MKKRGRKTRYRGVQALGNDSYRVRVYCKDPLTGRARERERVIQAESIESAMAQRTKLARELREGDDYASVARKTLGDVATDWLNEMADRRRSDGSPYLTPLTRQRYAATVRDFIVPFLGAAPAGAVTERDVEKWRNHLVGSGYRAATVNGHLRVLRQVLDRAHNSAARRVRALTEDDTLTTDDEPNLLSEDELARFLAIAKEDWPQHFALIVLLFSTAMRMGTALALRWEDLDLERGLIRVRRRVSGGEIVAGVKRSRRSADFPPLWPEVLEALEADRATFNEAQLASGLLFPTAAGGVRSRSGLNKPFTAILARAGIDKRLTPSSGPRRTAARLYRKVADSAVAMAVAGHLTDDMHRHYGRVDVEEKQQAASRLRAKLNLVDDGDNGRESAPKPGFKPGRSKPNRESGGPDVG